MRRALPRASLNEGAFLAAGGCGDVEQCSAAAEQRRRQRALLPLPQDCCFCACAMAKHPGAAIHIAREAVAFHDYDPPSIAESFAAFLRARPKACAGAFAAAAAAASVAPVDEVWVEPPIGVPVLLAAAGGAAIATALRFFFRCLRPIYNQARTAIRFI